MTIKEWVKEHPKVAAYLFECSVDDLDNIIDEEVADVNAGDYLTRADIDKLIELMENSEQ